MNTHNKLELPPLPDLPAYSPEVFDREVKVVSETMVEQLMHDYARAAIEADRKTTERQLTAYRGLVNSLEARLAHLQAQHDELKKSTNPDLLASERAANAMLTEELEADRKRRGEPVASDKCSQDVYENGVSIGLFDIPKHTINEICAGITSATGARVDWHYIGGRVHLKALPAPEPAEPDSAKCAECGAELIPVRPGKWQHPDCPQSPWAAEPVKVHMGSCNCGKTEYLRAFLDAAKEAGIYRLDLAHIYAEQAQQDADNLHSLQVAEAFNADIPVTEQEEEEWKRLEDSQ